MKNGYGEEKNADGSSFQGFYLLGKKNGEGTFHYENGNSYKGNWKNDQIQGKVNLLFYLILLVNFIFN